MWNKDKSFLGGFCHPFLFLKIMSQLKELPSVNEVLIYVNSDSFFSHYKRNFLKSWINKIFTDLRKEVISGKFKTYSRDKFRDLIVHRLRKRIENLENFGIRKVINGTGVIIHTNLGRAPIEKDILNKIPFLLGGYTNLEFNLEDGRRGHRDDNVSLLFQELLNVESAAVVNNNAAAVFLVLNTLAKGKEVLVSRGELVEIGGSFRIPEIMERSGAILREVGTTNKTKIEDYENNINENTAMILKVHRSNFKISGFTHTPETKELVELSKKNNLIFYEDAGSGLLFEDSSKFFTNSDEPVIEKELELGVNIISFSGDKLFGGPQGGIILGKKEYIDKIKKNQLMRILRVDKFGYFLISETLKKYFTKSDAKIFDLINCDYEELYRRCKRIRRRIKKIFPNLKIEIEKGFSMIGGGSTPEEKIPSPVIKFYIGEPDPFLKILRNFSIPVILRIEDNSAVLDLRTVLKDEEKHLVFALQNALELYYEEV